MNKEKMLKKQIEEAHKKIARLKEAKRKGALAVLLESGIDNMKISLSVEAIRDRIQDMAERVAQIEAKDVMPLDSALNQVLGAAMGQKVSGEMIHASRDLLDALKAAKDVFDKTADIIANPDGAQSDMGMDNGDDDDDGFGDDDMSGLTDSDVDELTADGDMDDEAGGQEVGPGEDGLGDEGKEAQADLPVEPGIGRERKESAIQKGRKLVEAFKSSKNPDGFVVELFQRYMLEGNIAKIAAKKVAETLSIDYADVRNIVKEAAKKRRPFRESDEDEYPASLKVDAVGKQVALTDKVSQNSSVNPRKTVTKKKVN